MKEKILEILKKNQDQYISGQAISREFNVSRTAVWKHISQLKAEGYNIESISNRGYRLIDQTCEINQYELNQLIKKMPYLEDALFFETIDSTNDYAKKIGNKEIVHPTLIVAETQLKGRGRMGRIWESEKDTGLWMSLLLKPDLPPHQLSKLTLLAAAAVSQAIDELTGLKTLIKWPNDVILENKKVCGILTEMSAELNHVNYVVLGIGINVNQSQFHEDLRDKATSIKIASGRHNNRYELLKKVLFYLFDYYEKWIKMGDYDAVIAYNKKNTATLGQDVNLLLGNEERMAHAIDIDDEGNLIVQNSDGKLEPIYYGEVSIRGINGYN